MRELEGCGLDRSDEYGKIECSECGDACEWEGVKEVVR